MTEIHLQSLIKIRLRNFLPKINFNILQYTNTIVKIKVNVSIEDHEPLNAFFLHRVSILSLRRMNIEKKKKFIIFSITLVIPFYLNFGLTVCVVSYPRY